LLSCSLSSAPSLFSFFFTVPPPTALSSLSLHDALPISPCLAAASGRSAGGQPVPEARPAAAPPAHPRRAQARAAARKPVTGCPPDRKSTRLNSSHVEISYAVFCLKKKKKKKNRHIHLNL